MTVLEVGNLNGLIILVLAVMFGPPVLLTIIGFSIRKNHPQTAKVFYILGVVYLIAGLGICGSMFLN